MARGLAPDTRWESEIDKLQKMTSPSTITSLNCLNPEESFEGKLFWCVHMHMYMCINTTLCNVHVHTLYMYTSLSLSLTHSIHPLFYSPGWHNPSCRTGRSPWGSCRLHSMLPFAGGHWMYQAGPSDDYERDPASSACHSTTPHH